MAVYINEFNSYLYALNMVSAIWVLIYSENLRKKALFALGEVCALYGDKIKENTELKNDLSILRQKYSRTNQPRSGGKFVKNKIPFKCPKGDYSCPYVDTMTSTLDGDCNSCKYSPL